MSRQTSNYQPPKKEAVSHQAFSFLNLGAYQTYVHLTTTKLQVTCRYSIRYALTNNKKSQAVSTILVIVSDDLLGGDTSPEGVWGAFYLEIADFSVLIIIAVERLRLVQWEFPLQSNMHYWNIFPMETCGWQLALTTYIYTHKDEVTASATRDRFPFMYFFHFHRQTCSRYFLPTPTILLFLSISSSYSPNPSSSQPCLCNVDPYSSQTPNYGRIQVCYLLE